MCIVERLKSSPSTVTFHIPKIQTYSEQDVHGGWFIHAFSGTREDMLTWRLRKDIGTVPANAKSFPKIKFLELASKLSNSPTLEETIAGFEECGNQFTFWTNGYNFVAESAEVNLSFTWAGMISELPSVKVKAIVAKANNTNVIGNGNTLPWRLKEDLTYFNAMTVGCPIIVGRKTLTSIGNPLPNRHNIVLTHDKNFGEMTCLTRKDGMLEAIHYAIIHSVVFCDCKPVWICGGESVYEEAIPFVSELHITHVDAEVNGDTFFPYAKYLEAGFKSVETALVVKANERNQYDFETHIYKKG